MSICLSYPDNWPVHDFFWLMKNMNFSKWKIILHRAVCRGVLWMLGIPEESVSMSIYFLNIRIQKQLYLQNQSKPLGISGNIKYAYQLFKRKGKIFPIKLFLKSSFSDFCVILKWFNVISKIPELRKLIIL